MHLQNFIKIHQLVHKILSINEISISIKGHNSVENEQKYCSIIQIYILSKSMHIQNLIEIHKLICRILSINKFLTSIKDHNSVKNGPKPMCIRYNMDLVFVNAYTKLYQNSSICSEDIEDKHIFISSKGQICSIIQIYILSISMHIQNFIEINKLIQKILSINKILMSIKGHNFVKN